MTFSKTIIHWYNKNKRDLPWRNTTDPYIIWLSEIILQQTRVEQGLPYFERFIAKFPTVRHLASAREEEVLNLWQGLGYYSRARNLHKSAKHIVENLNGTLPPNFKLLLELKGVGKYTAAAIASFAYKEVVPVVDGNVYRVLSRYFGIEYAIDSGKGQKHFFELAQELIPKKSPDIFNQGIMEFGALHCLPKLPKCFDCVLSDKCIAKAHNKQNKFPIKMGKTKVKELYISYFVFLQKNKEVIIRKRNEKNIWANLYDFPSIENDVFKALSMEIKENLWLEKAIDSNVVSLYKTYKHILSHRKIFATFYIIEGKTNLKSIPFETKEIKRSKFNEYPVPKLIENFWHSYS